MGHEVLLNSILIALIVAKKKKFRQLQKNDKGGKVRDTGEIWRRIK